MPQSYSLHFLLYSEFQGMLIQLRIPLGIDNESGAYTGGGGFNREYSWAWPPFGLQPSVEKDVVRFQAA